MTRALSFATNPGHPFNRIPSGWSASLDQPDIKEQVDRFILDNYKVSNLTVAAISHQKKDEERAAIFDQLQSTVLSQEFSAVINKGETPATDYGLPHKALPKLIAMKDSMRDKVKVTFQVSNSYLLEAANASVKFVTVSLYNLVRAKLFEMNLCHNMTVSTEHFSDFSLINVDIHLSYSGKDKVDQILAIVLAAIEKTKSNNNIDYYHKLKEELQFVYDSSPALGSRKLGEEIVANTPKYGFYDAFRVTRTLNTYSQVAIANILDQMNMSNMLVALAGDFAHVVSGPAPNGEAAVKPIDLLSALQTRVTRDHINIASPNFQTTHDKNGSIQLSGVFSGFGLYYHSQQIDSKLTGHLLGVARRVEIKDLQANPFTPTAAQMAKLAGAKASPARQRFSKDGNQVQDMAPGFFFRENKAYLVPMTYISLRFYYDLPVRSTLPTVMSFQFALLVLERVWQRRLILLSSYLRQFNGDLDVFSQIDTLALHLYTHNEHFERALKQVIDQIDISGNTVSMSEYREGFDHVTRMLRRDPSLLASFEDEFRRLITSDAFTNEQFIKHIHENYKYLMTLKINPVVIFGLVEGHVSHDDAKRFYELVRTKFTL